MPAASEKKSLPKLPHSFLFFGTMYLRLIIGLIIVNNVYVINAYAPNLIQNNSVLVICISLPHYRTTALPN